jgi:two-component system OmpR family sensor kinase
VGRLAGALYVMLGRIQSAFSARDATEARLRQFAADASHELRTPLAAVSAYAELFERGAESRPEDLARVMKGIRQETTRMGSLVEDLLLLARMDEHQPMELGPLDLVAVAGEAVESARAVGPEWPVSLEAEHPVEIVGDRRRLRQVIDNLLGNVRSHTPAGTSTTVRVWDAGDAAICEVSDDGPGISAEEASRLFERFYRADPSRSRASGGSGLGLSIVAAIVGAHGGSVGAAPGKTGGSVFSFRIPRGS